MPHGDIDGDGRAEIPVTSPWGIGILELSGGTLDSLMLEPNGTRFGGWLLNTDDNHLHVMADLDGDGRDELLITSPWGIGILELSGGTLDSLMLEPNGTRFGGWLLDTTINRFGPVGDFDGDGKAEILVTSGWGLGILELSGDKLDSVMLEPNGTRFGGWLLNTDDNRFAPIGDVDGDGRDEILVTSPWGLGILELSGPTLDAVMMEPNGTRFGGWLLNTDDNHIEAMADFDGDGRDEILVTSPWGLGILELSGPTLDSVMLEPNGTRFGGWLLNTDDNHIDMVADFDGDGRDEILVTSPWGLGILELSGSTLDSVMLEPNGTRFGGWLLNTDDNRFGIGTEIVRVHLKVLADPDIAIDEMLTGMYRVYEFFGLRVHRVNTERLDLPDLEDVDVGDCKMGSVTEEQTELFGNRDGVGVGDIVVYFVRSTDPPLLGCAAHPEGQPSAVVAKGASRWTFAHEVGHILGLGHVDDNDRLMTGNSTKNITNPPPELAHTETNTMKDSLLSHAEGQL